MDEGVIVGAEPLTDGMHIAVRIRRDFTVTDAQRLLAKARTAFVELNPGSTEQDAAQLITGSNPKAGAHRSRPMKGYVCQPHRTALTTATSSRCQSTAEA